MGNPNYQLSGESSLPHQLAIVENLMRLADVEIDAANPQALSCYEGEIAAAWHDALEASPTNHLEIQLKNGGDGLTRDFYIAKGVCSFDRHLGGDIFAPSINMHGEYTLPRDGDVLEYGYYASLPLKDFGAAELSKDVRATASHHYYVLNPEKTQLAAGGLEIPSECIASADDTDNPQLFVSLLQRASEDLALVISLKYLSAEAKSLALTFGEDTVAMLLDDQSTLFDSRLVRSLKEAAEGKLIEITPTEG